MWRSPRAPRRSRRPAIAALAFPTVPRRSEARTPRMQDEPTSRPAPVLIPSVRERRPSSTASPPLGLRSLRLSPRSRKSSSSSRSTSMSSSMHPSPASVNSTGTFVRYEVQSPDPDYFATDLSSCVGDQRRATRSCFGRRLLLASACIGGLVLLLTICAWRSGKMGR